MPEEASVEVEIRASSVDEATIADIWVAGFPLGTLVERAAERGKFVEGELGTRPDHVDDDADIWAIVDQVQVEVRRLQDQVETLEDDLRRSNAAGDEKKASKLEKVEEIITHAVNRDGGGINGVQLDYGEVMAATDCSKQWAHTMMDEIGAKYDFASIKRPAGKRKQLCIRLNGRTEEEMIEEVYSAEHGG
jgi:hypothetical protein